MVWWLLMAGDAGHRSGMDCRVCSRCQLWKEAQEMFSERPAKLCNKALASVLEDGNVVSTCLRTSEWGLGVGVIGSLLHVPR